MKTTAIRIEGQIISPEIFDRFEANDIKGQTPKDFGFETGIKVKDEIARAWADAKDQWNIFHRRVEKLSETASGTSETRKFWIIPFLENLGYDLSIATAETVNDKSYAISHRAENIDGFPVHIMGINDKLDKRRKTGGPRLSPHALIQDYLNLTEHLYALVTNGTQLRLLRDSGKLIRLTYIEFNLEQMMEEDLYAEFALMYRLIHASRMPQKFDAGDESIIEQYHQDSLEAGSRIREGLSSAVEQSINAIANGFLHHTDNNQLREALRNNKITSEQFYQYMLRFIYRILFLLVIEERDIVYPSLKGKPELQRKKEIYYKYYSISRLRKLADEIFLFDDKLEDLWIALRNTFKIFGSEKLASKLGIYPLAGDLFGYDALGMLSESNLDNHTLLECIRDLCIFENPKTKSIIRVNYGALNVEEFGSVYEGLLEKAPQINDNGNELSFSFVKGTERSSSGSHYTPEELVQPLIKHSLDYVIEDKLKSAIARSKATKQSDTEIRQNQAEALLSIKVCDVAAGSGHILLAASRKIALELAKVRTNEDQPSPEPYREAIRDVIGNCIYGVDKNPLAVELCKVALWLEAHNPGMPLNFLDHKIKCGDSIVGLAKIEEIQKKLPTEAFKTLPEDDKETARIFRDKNKAEVKHRKFVDVQIILDRQKDIATKFNRFNELPDDTVENVAKKREEFYELKGSEWWGLKEAADLQVAQFFIPKTEENKPFITTDADYMRILAGQKAGHERKISFAMAIAMEKSFFHWFLEFPEIMQDGGFDCILGNPPYLGGKRISGHYGDDYLNYVKRFFKPAYGGVDLVIYFLRRIFSILNINSFASLISSKIISQGDSRLAGLEYLLTEKGKINFATQSIKWPGQATVEVILVSLYKGIKNIPSFIGNQEVQEINSFLSTEKILEPKILIMNQNKSFIGSVINGTGFILNKNTHEKLLLEDPNNRKVIFKYLNGDELNNLYTQLPQRNIVNLSDWSFEYCNKTQYLKTTVKPHRDQVKRRAYREKWWQYAEKGIALYNAIKLNKYILGRSLTSKYSLISKISNGYVYDQTIVVFAFDKSLYFSILGSFAHSEWSTYFCSDIGSTGRYNPTKGFQTFPFPQNISKETEEKLEKLGEEYHEFRRQLMLDLQLGLTKIYNLFHNPACSSGNLDKVMEIKEFKRANLQIPIEEAVAKIEKLRELHKQMDEAVLEAYGWGFDSAQPIDLAHDFYEVDYLPENDRVRYTISPEARKEVLKRLLELNHKIHAEEVEAGLWDKKKGKAKKKVTVKKDNDTIDMFGG